MQKKNTTYQKPQLTVVSFQVEIGIVGASDGMGQNRLNFGGDVDRGLMNPGQSNDRSGLGQYSDGGNIFGETL